MSNFLVVTGLSGAGRTQFGNTLEDLGWFVIDNLPSELIPKVAELAQFNSDESTSVALVVGTGPDPDATAAALEELRASDQNVKTVFLDASTPNLVRRYGDTRRRHPLLQQTGSVEEAIEAERALLGGVRGFADIVIDTTDMNVHDLRRRVQELFVDPESSGLMQVTVMSFGYKHGVPPDADLVFDCRFLPNPHWVEELRPHTGLEEIIQDYVLDFDVSQEFIAKLESLLDMLIPAYQNEGKSVLTVAFGCTGGRHRSVTMAELFAKWFDKHGLTARVRHRDVAK